VALRRGCVLDVELVVVGLHHVITVITWLCAVAVC